MFIQLVNLENVLCILGEKEKEKKNNDMNIRQEICHMESFFSIRILHHLLSWAYFWKGKNIVSKGYINLCMNKKGVRNKFCRTMTWAVMLLQKNVYYWILRYSEMLFSFVSQATPNFFNWHWKHHFVLLFKVKIQFWNDIAILSKYIISYCLFIYINVYLRQ